MSSTGLEIVVAKELVKAAIVYASKNIKKKSSDKVVFSNVEKALKEHHEFLVKWADQILLKDMSRPSPFFSLYVDLDLNLKLRRTRSGKNEDRSFKVSEIVSSKSSQIILGDPGAGKTTSLKRLVHAISEYNDMFRSEKIPILLRCRDIGSTPSLSQFILRILKVEIRFSDKSKYDADAIETAYKSAAISVLNGLNAILFIDGLDELPAPVFEGFVKDIEEFSYQSKDFRIIGTCRTGAFQLSINNFEVLEIGSLTEKQVEVLSQKWLYEKSGEFLDQIKENPYYGTEVRPLALAHMCLIFQRTGRVPDKPKSIYRTLVRLLLIEWDAQRSLIRKSGYSDFEIDRKEDFLEALSYDLIMNGNRGNFTNEALETSYKKICDSFNLPKIEARKVAREIESHTGLIVESGFDSFEFAHITIQEFLAAQFIVKSPVIPLPSKLVLNYPNEFALATVRNVPGRRETQPALSLV